MMNRTLMPGIVVASAVLAAGAFAAEPALTIYNQDFAVVRDSVPLDLKQGVNRVSFNDMTAHVEPDSVMLRDPAGVQALQILEQNYRSDPISQELLLNLYEGKTIDFQVQVEFVRAASVTASRFYIYDGAKIDWQRYRGWSMENVRQQSDYGTQSNPKVWVMREFDNAEGNGLGIPLPKGRMRFYRRGDAGQLEFIGESMIDHTPRDEKVRVYTGNAFDLVGERRRTCVLADSPRKN